MKFNFKTCEKINQKKIKNCKTKIKNLKQEKELVMLI